MVPGQRRCAPPLSQVGFSVCEVSLARHLEADPSTEPDTLSFIKYVVNRES